MTFSATSSEGRRSLVPRATQMSRSVIMPTTPPLESTTGRAPKPQVQSSSVTAARLVVGVQLFGEFLIKSRTIICNPLLLRQLISRRKADCSGSLVIDRKTGHVTVPKSKPETDIRRQAGGLQRK